jgi:hypothetical protein
LARNANALKGRGGKAIPSSVPPRQQRNPDQIAMQTKSDRSRMLIRAMARDRGRYERRPHRALSAHHEKEPHAIDHRIHPQAQRSEEAGREFILPKIRKDRRRPATEGGFSKYTAAFSRGVT